jgi:predicted anti-sigma-YlaC factor YlaD
MTSRRVLIRCGLLLVLALAVSGCATVQKKAINMVGDSLAGSGTTFSSDDDPELVKAAVPFGLKLEESLLAQSPRHKGLLFAACSGFTQYAYAFVQMEADYVEAQDPERATQMRMQMLARAKKLYLRAREYGLRGFDVDFPGFREGLKKNPDATLARLTRQHVPLLYWTAAAWGAAFAIDITDSQLSVDQPIIEKMMQRALALDESWGQGSIHDFFISWEAGHAGAGGSYDKAREHYKRSQELSAGQRVSPLVSLAESVSQPQQNKKEFEDLLNQAVQFDVEKSTPEQKLANVIAQKRAKWLLSRVDELF